jgi:hypothetical protein
VTSFLMKIYSLLLHSIQIPALDFAKKSYLFRKIIHPHRLLVRVCLIMIICTLCRILTLCRT